MKTLNKLLIPVLAVAFSFNSYSQKIEKTENGFKEYNKKGQLIKETYADDGQKLIIDYKYDEKENKIETIYKIDNENDGKFDYIEQTNLKYDEKGRNIEEIIKKDYENDERFDYLERYNYTYNEKGHKIKILHEIDKENDGKFEEYEEY